MTESELIFQSTPSVGRATINGGFFSFTANRFQSTPSVGRATSSSLATVILMTFQSTPSVGRATKAALLRQPGALISIHALRGEGDRSKWRRGTLASHFNPRPPWGGRPLSGRRNWHWNRHKISIHALRGEGDTFVYHLYFITSISIHALRGEGDGLRPSVNAYF